MLNAISLPHGHPWKDSLVYLETVDSTNTRAKALAASGASHGTVVFADCQRAGRGRLGRSFQSPPGMGIYLSVILRPNCAAEDFMHLTCAVGVAMCDAVENACGFRPGIKWINDLVANRRKLGGILTELAFKPGTQMVDYAVVGIGINCLQKPEDFPPELQEIACSAATVTGKEISRAKLLSAMIVALETMSRGLLSNKSAIMRQYRKDCVTLGQAVQVIQNEHRRNAVALDIDEQGGLVVRYEDSSVQTVSCGEVSVRGLYGYL